MEKGPSTPLQGRIIQDSRKVKAGDLYVALKGAHFEGHDFVADAFAGAYGALVNRQYGGERGPSRSG